MMVNRFLYIDIEMRNASLKDYIGGLFLPHEIPRMISNDESSFDECSSDIWFNWDFEEVNAVDRISNSSLRFNTAGF